MATVNWSIKSSGGDYTSLALAEAALPNTSDTYNISYDEALSDTTIVTWSGAYTSLTVNVTVAAAYRCKGAVTGSHAELNYATNDANNTVTHAVGMLITISHLRIIRSGTANTAADAVDSAVSAGGLTLKSCTIISDNCAGRSVRDVPSASAGSMNLYNCFVVDRNRPAGGAATDVCFFGTPSTPKLYRVCVFLANNTAAGLIRSNGASAVVDCRQVLAIKAAGATATNGCFYVTSSGTFNASCDANGATDTTTPGTNANNSLTPGNVFKVLTVGSEDLHYPDRSKMLALTSGSNLSGTVGTTDIDEQAIGAWYPGADFVPSLDAERNFTRLGLGLRRG